MTNKMLLAFTDISGAYVEEALQYSKRSSTRIWKNVIAACFVLILLTIPMARIYRHIHESNPVTSPPSTHTVGTSLFTYYGDIKYTSCGDTSFSFTIQNNTESPWTYDIFINADKLPDAETPVGYSCIVTTKFRYTNHPTVVLDDVLKVFIDGELSNNGVRIPADGRPHEVVIDFSFLVENNYTIHDVWKIEYIDAYFALLPDTETD